MQQNAVVEAELESNGDDEVDERGRPRRQNNHPPSRIKLKVPSFRGSSSPEEFLEWVRKVEKVFYWYEYTDEKKCKVVALEFTDYTLLWWENFKIQRRRDDEEDITIWTAMKRVIKKRFVLDYYKLELYIKLQTLRQGFFSVEELLMIRCSIYLGLLLMLIEPQEQTIARFIANVVEL
jgi:hypothetical protein